MKYKERASQIFIRNFANPMRFSSPFALENTKLNQKRHTRSIERAIVSYPLLTKEKRHGKTQFIKQKCENCPPISLNVISQLWSSDQSSRHIEVSNGFWCFWLVTRFICTLDYSTCWVTDRHCGSTPALDKCLALAQDRWEADRPGLSACLISALHLNWDELLTCGLIRRPHNWFSRSALRGIVPFGSRRGSGLLKILTDSQMWEVTRRVF